ncbi:MAG: dTDP-4-dehydrorhamnose 3,5-epimerase [Terriglobia bacterium]
MTVEIRPTGIPEVKVIVPRRYPDGRGYFSETYNKKVLAEAGIELDFVQDNHSLSVETGVVRGLHYQIPPSAQDKLVRVVRGAVFDVAVDLRKGSSTFGKFASVVLSAREGNQVLVPKGFAHGYCTLEPNTELVYKVTAYYSPESERGVLWNDSRLNIPWPITEAETILSEKDKRFLPLAEVHDLFE